jgi:hypothetical protein
VVRFEKTNRGFSESGIRGYKGDGRPAAQAELNAPHDAAADSQGNVYISDFVNCRVRKVRARAG